MAKEFTADYCMNKASEAERTMQDMKRIGDIHAWLDEAIAAEKRALQDRTV